MPKGNDLHWLCLLPPGSQDWDYPSIPLTEVMVSPLAAIFTPCTQPHCLLPREHVDRDVGGE